MSPQALAALIRLKGADRCILVTDAVLGAAAPPGIYSFAGMQIERAENGAMVQPGRVNLAGSALCLDAAVRNTVAWTGLPPEGVVEMAASAPRKAIARSLIHYGIRLDPGKLRWSSGLLPGLESVGAV